MKTITERAQDFYDAVFDKDLIHLIDVADGKCRPNKEEREECGFDPHDPADWARQRIAEHAYGLDEERVCYVTLAGGGPAARLKVIVDKYGEVEMASLQFQDWFEPWTDVPHQDVDLVERYARLIAYYGDGAR